MKKVLGGRKTMKKVLSVAMASAMVLGMGANAFAIQYSTGSSDTAAWPKGFQFDGSLFVTDDDGNIVTSTITDLNGKTRVDFQPGDVIWMPLYANNQKQYTVNGYVEGESEVAASSVTLKGVAQGSGNVGVEFDAAGNMLPFTYTDNSTKVVYWYGTAPASADVPSGYKTQEVKDVTIYVNGKVSTVPADRIAAASTDNVTENVTLTLTADDYTATKTNSNMAVGDDVDVEAAAGTQYAGATEQADVAVTGVNNPAESFNVVLTPAQVVNIVGAVTNGVAVTPSGNVTVTFTGAPGGNTATGTLTTAIRYAKTTPAALRSDVTVKVNLPKIAGSSTNLGTVDQVYTEQVENVVAYGHYTGNIDKNWSINLIEEDNGVADLIEKAELYKADEVDYLSYKDHTTEIMPNAVYLKVTLKDTWKLAGDVDMKYYVYVADNKSNTNVTNKVWVSGTYAASYRYVDFTWTNDASKAGVWKVKDGENGVAVFDFADKAFFQVKMYSKESMYLDLSTAYDKAIAGDFAEADSFFKFDNENANFSRTGTLILVSDDSSLIPYEITENGYNKVDAEYVTDFVVAHTNEKVDGFVFETKQLGNYVLSTEEVEVEEDDKDDNNQEVVVPDTDNKETENNSKPNPSTGAEDFVGLAVSLAVVSVAAAGALALKK